MLLTIRGSPRKRSFFGYLPGVERGGPREALSSQVQIRRQFLPVRQATAIDDKELFQPL